MNKIRQNILLKQICCSLVASPQRISTRFTTTSFSCSKTKSLKFEKKRMRPSHLRIIPKDRNDIHSLGSKKHFSSDPVEILRNEGLSNHLNYRVPHRLKQKITSASDAVELVRNGDTVCVSGFVSQGSPEAVLEALGARFEKYASPFDLTLLFGGGPGDHGKRGLSHLAKEKHLENGTTISMLKRTIRGHYGQVPLVSNCFSKICSFYVIFSVWYLPF